MTDGQVLVIGEVDDGHLEATTREVMAPAAALGGEMDAQWSLLLLGQGLDSPAREGIALGSETVFLVEHPLLSDHQPELWLVALEQALKQIGPAIVLMGRTVAGRDLAPRLAFRLGVGLLQDCIELSLDAQTHRLFGKRPVYGGNAIATVTSAGRPQIATVRPRTYEAPAFDHSRIGEVIPLDIHLVPDMCRTRLLGRREEKVQGLQLETARIIVSGGRGMKSEEGFRRLEELALLLGGAVGASRVPVDMGWTPLASQIGLTGKTVTPELYIAIGLSGAAQHLSGVAGKGAIVAINTDSEARIFGAADYGVVGDWRQVLPAFIDAVRDLVKGHAGAPDADQVQ